MTSEREPLGTLVVLAGPTASGKTAAAIELAQHFGTAVISVDSRQFYHAMRIGTARPTTEELRGVPHHFVGHMDLVQEWSAGAFAQAAEPVLQELIARHGIAIMAGGSGLYFDAVIKGLPNAASQDTRVRKELQAWYRSDGLEALLAELKAADPEAWERIDRNNPQRVLRALEVIRVSGKKFSERGGMRSDRTDIRIVRLAIDLDREELYQRIDARVDRMVQAGLVEEARSLLPFRHLNALRTIGYRELFEH
ncbi:MAG: tRNA (adenosine(37)-N6)-dimethylallyltransferase MiaA, partial [Flavobacteriales bacterium]|nr:tRNA (adenosine(37)-N6)-dimethylallyltransferase MiaA [Flavobacteriales bacterium]